MKKLKWFAFLGLCQLSAGAALAGDYAWWPLNDGSGDIAHNQVAGGTDGMIFDAATAGLGPGGSVWANDPVRGTVLGLRGTTGWVDAGTIPMMTMDSQFSWSFWAKQSYTQAVDNDIIIGNRYDVAGADTVPREFVKFTPTQYEFHMNGGAAGNIPYDPFTGAAATGVDIPSDDTWIHHAVVKEGSTLTYYRNGVAENSGPVVQGMDSPDPLPFAMGGQNGAETWRGYLSDVQLYTSALDVSGIGTAMGGNVAAGELYARWKLDDGDGDIAGDAGPNSFDGLIYDWDLDGLAGDGTVWVDDATRGTVLGLGGNTAWVDAGVLPLMDTENDFTWAFWARQDPDQASPANDIVIGNRYDADNVDTVPREFIKFTPDRFEYHMNGAGASDLQYDVADDGPWVNHIVVKDGDTLTYYRDGEEAGQAIITQDQLSDDPLPFFMGGQAGGVEAWAGYLSDVRLFDHALSTGEITDLSGGGGVTGDFDGNGVLDLADINLLLGGISAASSDYDLNSDGTTDATDLGIWVHDLKKTWIGDANFDGLFDSSDFVQVFQNGEYEDGVAGNSGWEDGDWTGDHEFDSSDFVAAFQDGGYEQGVRAATAAVPEPSTLVLTALGMLGVALRRRK
ncbi:MAG: PEP-CTERM sorting domain-containing protein [Planctomycetales bacterium]|nr:PEP-CTERM sorting domain-containing protein [Planctomycetales bacterium]